VREVARLRAINYQGALEEFGRGGGCRDCVTRRQIGFMTKSRPLLRLRSRIERDIPTGVISTAHLWCAAKIRELGDGRASHDQLRSRHCGCSIHTSRLQEARSAVHAGKFYGTPRNSRISRKPSPTALVSWHHLALFLFFFFFFFFFFSGTVKEDHWGY